ncbi:MAG: diacylglycerol kinase family lipid kinase [Bacteroidetes bacterium]|nr:diacylglycerol kinase family lipid kinase [Bacteroidota bacterium]
MEPRKANILFIVNPKAGITIKSKLFIRLLAGHYLDSERYMPEIQFTQYVSHATEIANEAVKNGIPTIVAVGGDGTINEVASALVNTGTVMGILPTGSGNGLAHHLKIPMNLISALRVINKGNSKLIDTISINNSRLFTSIAGIGFDAMVAEKFASSGVRGLFSYMRIIIQEFKNYQPVDYEMVLDGKIYNKNALFISFANSDQFGFRSRIAPQARIDDGWLDVCVVTKPSFFKVFFIAPRVFVGTVGKTGYAEYFKAKEVEIRRSGGSQVNIDGEAVTIEQDMKLKINPLSLRVIVKD